MESTNILVMTDNDNVYAVATDLAAAYFIAKRNPGYTLAEVDTFNGKYWSLSKEVVYVYDYEPFECPDYARQAAFEANNDLKDGDLPGFYEENIFEMTAEEYVKYYNERVVEMK